MAQSTVPFCLRGLAAALVVATAGWSSASAQEEIVIKFADFHPVDTLVYEAMERFEEMVEERTDGRVDVQLFPAAQLGGNRDLIEQTKVGSIQMTYGNPPYFSNLVPEFAVMDLPYMFADYDHVERVADGEVGSALTEMLIEQQGLRILGWYHIGFRHMMTREVRIASLEDFEGVKFRSPEAFAFVEMFKALDAVPVPLPWHEVYNAMRTKIVDGMETTPEGFTSTKVYEVGNYMTLTNHINTVETPAINEAFYQNLPDDIRTVIDDVMAELVAWQRKEQIARNEAATEELIERGVELVEIDRAPLRTKMEAVWEKFTIDVPTAADLIEKVQAQR